MTQLLPLLRLLTSLWLLVGSGYHVISSDVDINQKSISVEEIKASIPKGLYNDNSRVMRQIMTHSDVMKNSLQNLFEVKDLSHFITNGYLRNSIVKGRQRRRKRSIDVPPTAKVVVTSMRWSHLPSLVYGDAHTRFFSKSTSIIASNLADGTAYQLQYGKLSRLEAVDDPAKNVELHEQIDITSSSTVLSGVDQLLVISGDQLYVDVIDLRTGAVKILQNPKVIHKFSQGWSFWNIVDNGMVTNSSHSFDEARNDIWYMDFIGDAKDVSFAHQKLIRSHISDIFGAKFDFYFNYEEDGESMDESSEDDDVFRDELILDKSQQSDPILKYGVAVRRHFEKQAIVILENNDPSAEPTQQPTSVNDPSAEPTQQPTFVNDPSAEPTQQPTFVNDPSAEPTVEPSNEPTTVAPTSATPTSMTPTTPTLMMA